MSGSSVAAALGSTGNATYFGSSHVRPMPIVGLNYSQSQDVVVAIIYTSFWLGALAWEVFVTIPFDYRLVIETNWRSFLSTIHSLAYLLSRYATIAYIAVFAQTAATQTDRCDLGIVTVTALFSVSLCSINLVFMLRTIALWNIRPCVVAPLLMSWLAILGFGITLPFKVSARQIGDFCLWQTSHLYVGATFVAVIIFGLLNLYLTVLKLNRKGWKSVARGLVPRYKDTVSSEDVREMLVQRTSAYFLIQLLLIILLAVLYFDSKLDLPYRLMNFVAFKTITSSMAGKLFRRSWRLTRSVDKAGKNRPPSYFPGWAEDGEGTGRGSQEVDGSQASTLSRESEEEDSKVPPYVEGEFYRLSSASSSMVGSKTPAQLLASKYAKARSISSAKEGIGIGPEVVVNMEAAGSALDRGDGVQSGQQSVHEDSITPAVLLPHPSKQRGSRRTGKRLRSPKTVRPQTKPLHNATERRVLRREEKEMEEKRPFTMAASPLSTSTLPSEVFSISAKTDVGKADHIRHILSQSSSLPRMAQIAREDLNITPRRSRLWLDSSAERARMEAAASGLASPSPNTTSITWSHSEASTLCTPSLSSSSRTKSVKRSILDNANDASEKFQNQTWRFTVPEEARPSTADTRASFLPSPAIIPGADTLRLNRSNYDFDAMQQSLQDVGKLRSPRFNGAQGLIKANGDVSSDVRPGQQASRPKTAPSRSSSSEKVLRVGEGAPSSSQVEKESHNALEAFRRVIDEDGSNLKEDAEDASRPRTSRGGRLGAFGQGANGAFAGGSGDDVVDKLSRNRPTTSNGTTSVVKPFGSTTSPPISAIEEQYQMLAAYVESNTTRSKRPDLERIESQSTMEHLA